ncbi:MAG: alpha/beta hydrolase, partial [Rhizomicrobium sp.]
SSLFEHFSRLSKPQCDEAVIGLAEIRRQYDYLTARFGPAPAECAFEPGRFGPIKGEWTRWGNASSGRLVLYFHGGGYVAGSPESNRPLVARLAQSAEAPVFSAAYRLAPEHVFPAAVRDGLDLYRHCLDHGINPATIALAGSGSGGGLALAVLVAIRNAGLPMPAALVAMSPWADMTLSSWSMLKNAGNDALLSWNMLFVSARTYLKNNNPADSYASPLFASFKGFPPLMIHAGSQEILRDDAARIGDKAAEAGVPVSIEIYDGMPHLFQASSYAPEAKVSLQRLGQFIRSRIQTAVMAAGSP